VLTVDPMSSHSRLLAATHQPLWVVSQEWLGQAAG